jgi:DNA-binding MarR family transcriptional regulator
LEDRENSKELGVQVRTLNHMIGRKVAGIVQHSGLDNITMMQGMIMQYLYENTEQEIYQKDIEAKFCITRSTVTSILQLMEKKGYIRRVSVEKDARLKRILLTEKASAIQSEIYRNSHGGVEAVLRKGLSEEDIALFARCISTMKQNLEDSGFPNGKCPKKGESA